MIINKNIRVLISAIIFLLIHFFGNTQTISNFSTDLPLVIIDTEGKTIVDDPKIQAKMKIINNSNGLNNYNDLPNDFSGNIGIELRGSSSIGYPQKPYLFETRDASGKNLKFPLLGFPEEKDWILLSNYNDKSLMRNILGFQIFERLGNYSPRTKLVDVIVNNEYQGIYVLTEKIKQDPNRVDIAKLRKEDIEGEELTGGYIFKIDYWNSNNSWESPYSPINHSNFKIHFVYHDPDWDELTSQQKSYISSYVTSFEKALYSAAFKDENQGYTKFINVKSFIDYFLVSELSRNNDGFKKSQYFNKDKNGKIVAGPVWDFDWAWKNINECFIFKATDGSGWSYKVNDCNPDVNSPAWMERLFQDENFKDRVNCSYFEARANVISDEAIYSMIDSVYNVVKNAQVKHFQKWQILGKNVGAPEIDQQPAAYLGEVQKLKNWITKRLTWLDKNIPGKCSTVYAEQFSKQTGIRVFPNPATTVLNINGAETLRVIQIYDITGKTVYYNHAVNAEKVKIDVSSFKKGMIVVKLIDRTGYSQSEKIVIK